MHESKASSKKEKALKWPGFKKEHYKERIRKSREKASNSEFNELLRSWK